MSSSPERFAAAAEVAEPQLPLIPAPEESGVVYPADFQAGAVPLPAPHDFPTPTYDAQSQLTTMVAPTFPGFPGAVTSVGPCCGAIPAIPAVIQGGYLGPIEVGDGTIEYVEQEDGQMAVKRTYVVEIPSGAEITGITQGKNVVPAKAQKKNIILDRLQMLYEWYTNMVSHANGRLEYSFSPVGDPEPPVCIIRDIGAIWELELVSHFLGRYDLNDVIEHSLDYYCKGVIKLPDGIGYYVDPRFIKEPSTIAHSAMLLLSILWDNVRRYNSMAGLLAAGLLAQQRPDGSFKVNFGPEADGPMWMYGCEAICALAEAYRWLRDARFARAVEQGMRFYDTQVYLKGYVESQLLPFFISWQCHACRLLFDAAADAAVWGDVPPSAIQHRFADYSYRMVDKLIREGFFDDFNRPPYVSCVALSCALEGLNDAFAMAKVLRDDSRVRLYGKCIREGVQYLLSLQCIRGYARPERELGGFAFSAVNRNQRVDFAGPAARAMMKCLTNGIQCPRSVM